jgi:hypothetical protein
MGADDEDVRTSSSLAPGPRFVSRIGKERSILDPPRLHQTINLSAKLKMNLKENGKLEFNYFRT